MPNWCSNVLTLKHEDPAMLARARRGFLAGKLLAEFLPCPEELLDEGSTAHAPGDAGQKYDDLRNRLREKYGFASWYDWQVSNWGTKWDVGADGAQEDDYPIDGDTITFHFDSAWSPPVEAMSAFEEEGFVVHLSYHEPGIGFCGYFSTEDGDDEFDLSGMTSEQVQEEIPDWLDDMFAITETMAEYESQQDYEEEE